MLNFFKRQGVVFYLAVVAFVLTLVGIILAGVSNGVEGYDMQSLGSILACSIIALVLIAAGAVLSDIFGSHNFIVAIVNIVALVLLMVAFCSFISERAILASAQFSYDSSNETGWTVLYESIVSIVMFLISAILLTVNAFLNNKNEAQKA